jgi:penicillin-insensitive murein endopeptidase
MKKQRIKKILKISIVVTLIFCFVWSAPVVFFWNNGKSIVKGSSNGGTIENPYKMDLYGKNFSYFSYLSYFGLGMCFTSERVYNSLKDCMKALESSAAGKHFYIMELSRKNGGKTLLHQTHRAGLSVDLMVPKLNKNGKQTRFYDHCGLWHYCFNFDKEGRMNIDNSVQIDFESLALLIHELEIAAAKNGSPLQRVIIRDEIRDNLFKTPSAARLNKALIASYPQNKFVNKMHDDHIHVDFVYL